MYTIEIGEKIIISPKNPKYYEKPYNTDSYNSKLDIEFKLNIC